jgi:hypothetical protein
MQRLAPMGKKGCGANAPRGATGTTAVGHVGELLTGLEEAKGGDETNRDIET